MSISDNQAHLNSSVAALGDAIAEAVKELKEAIAAGAKPEELDFSALDNLVSQTQAEAKADQFPPAPADGGTPAPTDPAPSDPAPSDPTPAPAPSDPTPTDPAPVDPGTPADPQPTDPAPTDPGAPTDPTATTPGSAGPTPPGF